MNGLVILFAAVLAVGMAEELEIIEIDFREYKKDLTFYFKNKLSNFTARSSVIKMIERDI